MDIRYFESLLKVVELGSIAAAARAQNLTPAAVGQRIRALEDHFKVSLLNRKAHKATPTDACYRLLPQARDLLKQFHSMAAAIVPEGLAGEFKLGAISTAHTGLLPGAIRHLKKIAPKLVLKIIPGTSNSLLTDLGAGKLDAAIIVLPPSELPRQLTAEVLRKEPLLLISNQARGTTPREKLQQNPYICYSSESWGGQKALQFLKDRKIDTEPLCELDGLEAIEKLVHQRMGVTLVPHWSGLDLAKPGLEVDIIRDKRYTRSIVIVYPNDCSRPRIVAALRETLWDSTSHEV
ncbi:MAG: LysR family transcriptional regulator [Xanthomonadales bacterium]|nr:LysR family transcriptional regulator [Xanthomonadales bacterium]